MDVFDVQFNLNSQLLTIGNSTDVKRVSVKRENLTAFDGRQHRRRKEQQQLALRSARERK